MRAPFLLGMALTCAAACLSGCRQGGSDDLPPEPVLLPVKGKVTVQGKPLATAVVTFLPTDAKGTLSVGESDEDGAYEITYMGKSGTAAGSTDLGQLHQGEGQHGHRPRSRSGLSKPYRLVTAKELVVPSGATSGGRLRESPSPKGGPSTSTSRSPCSPTPPGPRPRRPAAPAAKDKAEPAPGKAPAHARNARRRPLHARRSRGAPAREDGDPRAPSRSQG
ncbi:MAG: hypothetical protein U0835_04585 [Isosphaeraceae bacterium]